MRFISRFLLCLLLALAAPLSSPHAQVASPAPATPALWKATGARGTLYLFGTIHLLPVGLEWRGRAVNDAFAASDRLVLELAAGDLDPATLAPLMLSLGLQPPGKTLAAELGQPLYDRLATAGLAVGIPNGSLMRMRPWLAAVSLAALSAKAQGFDPEAGADKVFLAEAMARGLPVVGLETAAEQFGALARLDAARAREMVEQSLDELQEAPALFATMLGAWKSGDAGRIDAELVRRADSSPALNEALLYSRNRNWMPKLLALLAEPGSSFVAVGAGHLVGDQGIVALLRKAGMTVEQVAP